MVIFSGLYTFCSKRKHILLILLSIEFIVLGFFFFILFTLRFNNLFFSLIFLTFTACEGVLGLGVLINISRVYGADYFSVFNFYEYDNYIFFFIFFSLFFWLKSHYFYYNYYDIIGFFIFLHCISLLSWLRLHGFLFFYNGYINYSNYHSYDYFKVLLCFR